jgi:hypothetical protein
MVVLLQLVALLPQAQVRQHLQIIILVRREFLVLLRVNLVLMAATLVRGLQELHPLQLFFLVAQVGLVRRLLLVAQ